MPVGISYNKGDWRVLMELTLKNEHCAVTVTDAGAMLRSLVRDGREYLWQGDPAGLLSHCGGAAQGGVYRIWQALPYEAPRRGPH